MSSAKGVNDNDEWFTPKYVISKVKEVFGGEIDLDPASCLLANNRILANNYYTKNNSCLGHKWNGKVFLNPPYSNSMITKILLKAIVEFERGHIEEIIILTNSGTDTKWNQILRNGLQAYTIGRIKFVDSSGSIAGTPSRGQVFTYYGKNKNKFSEVFLRDNFCWLPNAEHLILGESNVINR